MERSPVLRRPGGRRALAGVLIPLRRIRVVEAGLDLPGAPPATALFISDVHARTRAALGALGRLVEETPADLLLLGGDYVERLSLCGALADALARGRFPLGRFAVWGNNERRGRGLLRGAFARAGVRLLENASVLVWAGGRPLAVAGVLDPHRDRPDLAAALRGIPEGVPVLLLAHSPDVLLLLPDDAAAARPAAVLCGHTHGGQVAFPGLGALWAHARVGRCFASGRHRVGGVEAFVGRGIGWSLLPLRTVPPEAYIVRLAGAVPASPPL